MTPSSLGSKLPGTGAARTSSRWVLELFVILCLTVCYYFLVRNFFLGVGDNHTNNWVFTACSQLTYHLDELYDVWKGRLSGMLLSGSLFDWSAKDDGYQLEQYAMLFGLYQAFWLLVLMLTMLVAVRESLLVNLCIFAGLIFNFAPAAGFYFYPWDLPATVFLTLAVLLHERGHRVLMLAAIGVGCFFKETVLVGAILCLFNRGWKWPWRLVSFLGLAALYILGKHCLMDALHLKTAVLAMGDSTSVGQLVRADYLLRNLKVLFSGQATQVLFANAGTLVAVLAVGWEKRFRPYMWMLLAYVVGQFMYGEFNEVRIFMQVLPLSCLILSECGQGWTRRPAEAVGLPQTGSDPEQPGRKGKGRMKAPVPKADKSATTKGESVWACRKSDRGLIWLAVLVMVVSSLVVVWDGYALLRSRQPWYQAGVLAGMRTQAERGEAAAQYMLGNYYYRGPSTVTNWPEAFNWFRKAAESGNPGAQLAVGMCCLKGEGTAQNYEASIPWFRKVTALDNQKVRCYFELDYEEGFSAQRGLVNHFGYLAWLGPLALAAAGLLTVVGVALRRKSFIHPELCIALVLAAGALSWRWRYGGLETLWSSIVGSNPNWYLANKNLGYALLQTGQGDAALTCFRRAMELEPDNATAHFNIGNALCKNGRLDEAIGYYQKVAELQPADAGAHFNLATVFFQKRQPDEAVRQLQKAVELQPDDAAAHNNLGYVLLQMGQLDEAIRQYHEALRLKPDLAEASNNLAAALRLKEAAAKSTSPPAKP